MLADELTLQNDLFNQQGSVLKLNVILTQTHLLHRIAKINFLHVFQCFSFFAHMHDSYMFYVQSYIVSKTVKVLP